MPDVALGHVIVPTSAVRDEGTSYHYLAPSRSASPTPQAVDAIVKTLEAHHVPFVTGATWTTDALYPETRGKVERRVAEGCLTVEMEAAAFFAVAAFRGVTFGQLLYARRRPLRRRVGRAGSGASTRPVARPCSAWPPRRCFGSLPTLPRPLRPPAEHGAGSISSRHGPRRDDRWFALPRPQPVGRGRPHDHHARPLRALLVHRRQQRHPHVPARLLDPPGICRSHLILNLIGTQFIALALLLSSPWLALGALLVIPSFVSVFRTGRRIALMQVHAGVEETSPGIGLVLFLLFFLVGAGIYLQAGLNRVWAAAGSHPEPEPVPEPVGVTMPGGVPSVAAGPRTDARATGNNLVDPHDVGSRVTFQFELPNGYTTEAVGVFERWDEDAQTYFVRKKDGTEVRVPARGVRHGKVIPPAPQPTA